MFFVGVSRRRKRERLGRDQRGGLVTESETSSFCGEYVGVRRKCLHVNYIDERTRDDGSSFDGTRTEDRMKLKIGIYMKTSKVAVTS